MYEILNEINILLAEDEKELAKLMQDAIGEYFKNFMVVHNGIDALKAYREHQPHIIISDILMPKLSGLELCKELRKENNDIPIIILSAHSEKKQLLQAIDYNVTKYFIKPFDPDELLEYIQTLIPKIKKQKVIKLEENFKFNFFNKQLCLESSVITLTKREVAFMSLILQESEYMADNELIKVTLWNDQVSDERLRTFIRRLRSKTSKSLIKNNSGLGYSISPLL